MVPKDISIKIHQKKKHPNNLSGIYRPCLNRGQHLRLNPEHKEKYKSIQSQKTGHKSPKSGSETQGGYHQDESVDIKEEIPSSCSSSFGFRSVVPSAPAVSGLLSAPRERTGLPPCATTTSGFQPPSLHSPLSDIQVRMKHAAAPPCLCLQSEA